MIGRFGFEDLWESGDDGAFSPIGATRPQGGEVDALMDAWLKERHVSIESRLYLEQAGRLIREMMDVDKVPPDLRKRAKCLLRAVRASQRDAGDEE
jgi:hypothetical protein